MSTSGSNTKARFMILREGTVLSPARRPGDQAGCSLSVTSPGSDRSLDLEFDTPQLRANFQAHIEATIAVSGKLFIERTAGLI